MLDVGTQCGGIERRLYGIDPLSRHLDHQVSARIDAEGVVAECADHPVIARTASDDVVAGSTQQRVVAVTAVEGVITHPTGHDVVQRVAVAGEVAGSGVEQILDIGAQCVTGQRRLHGIGPLTRRLDHQVPG
ncbi:hypothetical protein D3C76_1120650 [compost metagenome]